MRLLGVDGCRAGWVVAVGDAALGTLTFALARTFAEVLGELAGERALVAVDIPIGLPSGRPRDDGRRRCDAEARAFLGPRRGSSVFSAPTRAALTAATHREACARERLARADGRGLTQQTFRIVSKIREVDATVGPAQQAALGAGIGVWVREAHPEVTFAALGGGGRPGHGLAHSKRGCPACPAPPCPGERDRLALLRPYLPDFDPGLVRERLQRELRERAGATAAAAGRDDVVDAAAGLVTAYRIVTGQALTFPREGAELDARGLRMEILG